MTDNLIRTDGTAVYHYGFSPMQATKEGTFRDAQCTRSLHVETA
jgi:hypothetical protein